MLFVAAVEFYLCGWIGESQSRWRELRERERAFVMLEVKMCERTERKPVLVEYRGRSSQVGKSKPVKGF